MPKKISTFHIQNPVIPKNVLPILKGINHPDQVTPIDVFHSLKLQNIELKEAYISKCMDWMNKLGLLKKHNSKSYSFTATGVRLKHVAEFREETFFDLIHYLFFSRWVLGKGDDYWSWTYQRICELMWKDRSNIRTRSEIFSQISGEAKQLFANQSAAFGTETVGVVLRWLGALSPEVVILDKGNPTKIIERPWFSPELSVLSVSYLYKVLDLSFDAPLLLTPETISVMSAICFASESTMKTMIETASTTYPFLSLHVGEWGVSVILKHEVSIENVS